MISAAHKTIFVHIPKTAGQSIERLFLDDLGLSWDARATLLLRPNSDPARGPERLAHLFAEEYVSLGYVSAEDYAASYKFAIVRDPFSRCVSEYNYRYLKKRVSFDAFLKKRFKSSQSDAARHMDLQTTYVLDKAGRLLVDDIFHFETLETAVDTLTRRVFGAPRALPRQNITGAAGGMKVADLRADQKEAIYRRYRPDFERFGYVHG